MYETVETAILKGDFSAETTLFTEDQLVNAEWEHSKEFELNGCKYDILEVQIIDGVRVYKCINDTKESVLVNQLDRSGKVSYVLEDMLKKIQFNSLLFMFQTKATDWIKIVRDQSYKNQYTFCFLKFNFRPPDL